MMPFNPSDKMFVDLHIERKAGTYSLLITDQDEITKVDNLTKRQALKLYGALVIQAIEFGLQLSHKPVILTLSKNTPAARDRPVNFYPVSYEFRQWLNAA